MLRLFTTVAPLLTLMFTGMGLLIARGWGWSEYASPDLYVVYYQGAGAAKLFFIVNADGAQEGKSLALSGDSIRTLDCSPDGRTLALVTNGAHLMVLNQAGVVYDRALDQTYDDARVANNGSVALSQLHAKGDKQIVEPGGDHWLGTPADDAFDAPELASSGAALWTSFWTSGSGYGVKATSPDGAVTMFLPRFSAPAWFASEQTFSAFDYSAEPYREYLIDLNTHDVYRLPATSFVLSPDGTQAVDWVSYNHGENTKITTQLFIYDFMARNPAQLPLTHYVDVSSYPLCFLSFRPAMLIDQ